MYATYAYNAGATQAQIRDDLVALLTGAAVASLSASCNKAASIIAGVAPGWEVLDAANGVVRCADAAGGYVVASLDKVSLGGTPCILVSVYESWSAVAHVGVKQAGATDTGFALTAGAGAIQIHAVPGGFVFWAIGTSYWTGAFEIDAGPAVGARSKACAVHCKAVQSNCHLPSMKNQSAVGDVSPVSAQTMTPAGATGCAAARDNFEAAFAPLMPCYVATANDGGAYLGRLKQLMAMPANTYAQGDLLIDADGGGWVVLKSLYAGSRTYGFPRK